MRGPGSGGGPLRPLRGRGIAGLGTVIAIAIGTGGVSRLLASHTTVRP